MRLQYLALTTLAVGALMFLGACGGPESAPTAAAAAPAAKTGDEAIASLAAPAPTEAPVEEAAPAVEPEAVTAPAAEPAAEPVTEGPLRVVRAEESATRSTSGTPRIAVDEPIFDFGRMEVGQKREHNWIIRNIGDADLEIRNVRPSCGCTNTAVEDDVIPPGGSTTLASTLDLPRQTGPVRKNIAIHSNDPQQGTMVVAFVGEATQAIVLEPAVISFQNLERDDRESQTVELRATEDDIHFQITDMAFMAGDFFEVETETVEEGRHYRLQLSTVPPIAGSHVSERLTIETDSEKVPSLQLTMVANVISDIITAPDVIRLNAAQTDPLKRVILLRSGRVREFTITSVEVPVPSMAYTVSERQPGMMYIEVENIVATPELDGAEIVIHTDVPTLPEIRVPFAVVGATAALRAVTSPDAESR